jgi:hypothetical protein
MHLSPTALLGLASGCCKSTPNYEDCNQLSELPARAGVGSIGIRRILPMLFAVAQSARHDPHHDGLFWDAVHRMATADSDPVSDVCSGGCWAVGLMGFEEKRRCLTCRTASSPTLAALRQASRFKTTPHLPCRATRCGRGPSALTSSRVRTAPDSRMRQKLLRSRGVMSRPAGGIGRTTRGLSTWNSLDNIVPHPETKEFIWIKSHDTNGMGAGSS